MLHTYVRWSSLLLGYRNIKWQIRIKAGIVGVPGSETNHLVVISLQLHYNNYCTQQTSISNMSKHMLSSNHMTARTAILLLAYIITVL